ncbi:MAG TPA: dephospho-CoA kinase [Lachnospiraceae bacterium]|nr:dephospho-CoA kinase [Lachnospiraceae bacterium]
MKIIGITGGVGAGKSRVLAYLQEHYNCRIMMTDQTAKDLQLPGGACYGPVLEILSEADTGRELLEQDGTINKEEMASRIFADPDLLRRINALIHPAVTQAVMDAIAQEREAGRIDYFFLEAALLIETGFTEVVDSMWYIYADEAVRRQRLRETRGYDDAKTDRIMASQLSDALFRENCDTVIDNSGNFSDTAWRIDQAIASLG